MKIIFVCTGNTCRSPMAEGFFNMFCAQNGNDDVFSVSRGIFADAGASVSEFSVIAAKELGTDISSHKAAQLTFDDISSADYVFTMTSSHKELISNTFPGLSDKIFSMSDVASADIPDPFGGDISVYRESAKAIYDAVEKIYNNLTRK